MLPIVSLKTNSFSSLYSILMKINNNCYEDNTHKIHCTKNEVLYDLDFFIKYD